MLRFLRLSHYCVRKLLQSHSDLVLRSPPKSVLPTWVGVSKDGAALPPCMVRDALQRAALLTMRPGGFRASDTVALLCLALAEVGRRAGKHRAFQSAKLRLVRSRR